MVFLTVFITASGYSQDHIYKKKYKDTIYCTIVDDKVVEVFYKLYNSDDTTIYSIHTSSIEGYSLESERGKKSEAELQLEEKIKQLEDFINYKPKYLLAISAGAGQQYGRLGIKIQAGYNNSGVVAAIGVLKSMPSYQIGGQLAYNNMYLTYTYGTAGEFKTDMEEMDTFNAHSIMAGYLMSVFEDKVLFNFSLGYAIIETDQVPGYIADNLHDGIVLSLGAGFWLFDAGGH